MRKLASIQKIKEILPHSNADRLEIVKVNHWQVIVKKGEYSVGDRVVFFEIDSFIPEREELSFIPTTTFNDVVGHRIKTAKLRGERSQGLVMPLNILKEQTDVLGVVGEDVTEKLGVLKYEKFVFDRENTAPFPDFLRKSEQERIQNIDPNFSTYYFVTEKLDGESMTVWWDSQQEKVRVCSRNLELLNPEHYMFKAITPAMLDFCKTFAGIYAIQGEIIGPNVQGNIYGLTEREFNAYAVWDIKDQEYSPAFLALTQLGSYGVKTVPILNVNYQIVSVDLALTFADGYSAKNPNVLREGVVMWNNLTNDSFKVISNSFLETE